MSNYYLHSKNSFVFKLHDKIFIYTTNLYTWQINILHDKNN